MIKSCSGRFTLGTKVFLIQHTPCPLGKPSKEKPKKFGNFLQEYGNNLIQPKNATRKFQTLRRGGLEKFQKRFFLLKAFFSHEMIQLKPRTDTFVVFSLEHNTILAKHGIFQNKQYCNEDATNTDSVNCYKKCLLDKNDVVFHSY